MVDSKTGRLVSAGMVRIPEACAFLNLSRTAVYALMARGELVYCKFGRARRIPHRELLRFASESVVGRIVASGAGRDQ